MYPFDQKRLHLYEQYAYAYDTGDYWGVDLTQAPNILHHFLQSTPSESVLAFLQHTFAQMPPELRVQFTQQMPSPLDPYNPLHIAQGFYVLNQQQPGWLDHTFRQGGLFGNPAFKSTIMGMAGFAAKQLLHSHRGGGFESLPGGMFGYGQHGHDWQTPLSRRGDLEDIAKGLLGDHHHHRHRHDDWKGHRGYRRHRHHHDDDDDDDDD